MVEFVWAKLFDVKLNLKFNYETLCWQSFGLKLNLKFIY